MSSYSDSHTFGWRFKIKMYKLVISPISEKPELADSIVMQWSTGRRIGTDRYKPRMRKPLFLSARCSWLSSWLQCWYHALYLDGKSRKLVWGFQWWSNYMPRFDDWASLCYNSLHFLSQCWYSRTICWSIPTEFTDAYQVHLPIISLAPEKAYNLN